jgi:ssDNA-binding Zn-finger/Zn-ribbon topoisomerase 1
VSRFQPRLNTPLPCPECGGSGRIYLSRYGGNDPDVRDGGACDACHGSGDAECEECGNGSPATHLWRSRVGTHFVCTAHHAEWLEDELA